jgi:hypothetical protein
MVVGTPQRYTLVGSLVLKLVIVVDVGFWKEE